MNTQIITWYHNYKGGTNNLYLAQVRNSHMEVIKSFRSLKSMEHARKRAKAYQRTLTPIA